MTESLVGNVYRDTYHDAEFQVIAEQDGMYVCAWLDGAEDGFRVSMEYAPLPEWELVE